LSPEVVAALVVKESLVAVAEQAVAVVPDTTEAAVVQHGPIQVQSFQRAVRRPVEVSVVLQLLPELLIIMELRVVWEQEVLVVMKSPQVKEVVQMPYPVELVVELQVEMDSIAPTGQASQVLVVRDT
jgi:hypothetical protein